MPSYFQPLQSSVSRPVPKKVEKGKKRKRPSGGSSSPTQSPVHKKHHTEQKGNKKRKRSSDSSSSPSQIPPSKRHDGKQHGSTSPGKPEPSSSSPDSPPYGPIGDFDQDENFDEDEGSDEEMTDAAHDSDELWDSEDSEGGEDEDEDGEDDDDEDDEEMLDIYDEDGELVRESDGYQQPAGEESEDDPVEDEESDEEVIGTGQYKTPPGWAHFEVFGKEIKWQPRPATDISDLEGLVPGDEDADNSGSDGGAHEEERERIRSLCQEYFAKDGNKDDVRPRDVRIYHLMGGSYNQVYSVEIKGEPKYIVRMPRLAPMTTRGAKPQQQIMLALPISLFLQRHTMIPAPKVLYYSVTYQNKLKRPYTIVERKE